jgi:hypothetical protein
VLDWHVSCHSDRVADQPTPGSRIAELTAALYREVAAGRIDPRAAAAALRGIGERIRRSGGDRRRQGERRCAERRRGLDRRQAPRPSGDDRRRDDRRRGFDRRRDDRRQADPPLLRSGPGGACLSRPRPPD